MKVITIKDYYGKSQSIPVSNEFYEEWRKLEQEADRNRKKEEYHKVNVTLEIVEELNLANDKSSLADILIQQEEQLRLYEAIAMLTPIQQRRIKMYMDRMTTAEIARAEHCKYQVAERSLKYAFKHLKKILSDQ